jgi:hypothetical protein
MEETLKSIRLEYCTKVIFHRINFYLCPDEEHDKNTSLRETILGVGRSEYTIQHPFCPFLPCIVHPVHPGLADAVSPGHDPDLNSRD